MIKRPVVFIAGRPFAEPCTGLDVRTDLYANMLARIFCDAPKCLIVPISKESDRTYYEKMGWEVYPLRFETQMEQNCKRLLGALRCRLTDDSFGEILRVRGCSVRIPPSLIRKVQS